MKKRLLSLLLVSAMLVMTACGKDAKANDDSKDKANAYISELKK